jgi:hypothetical protein
VSLRRGTSLCVFLCVWGNFGELPYCARSELLSRACVGGKRFDLRTTSGASCLVREQPLGTSCLVREQPLGTSCLVREQLSGTSCLVREQLSGARGLGLEQLSGARGLGLEQAV